MNKLLIVALLALVVSTHAFNFDFKHIARKFAQQTHMQLRHGDHNGGHFAACQTDRARFCPDVGRPEIRECMHSHYAELSEECRSLLDSIAPPTQVPTEPPRPTEAPPADDMPAPEPSNPVVTDPVDSDPVDSEPAPPPASIEPIESVPDHDGRHDGQFPDHDGQFDHDGSHHGPRHGRHGRHGRRGDRKRGGRGSPLCVVFIFMIGLCVGICTTVCCVRCCRNRRRRHQVRRAQQSTELSMPPVALTYAVLEEDVPLAVAAVPIGTPAFDKV